VTTNRSPSFIVGNPGSVDADITSWNSVALFDDNGKLPSQSGLTDRRGRIAEATVLDIPALTIQWRFSDKPTDDGGVGADRRQDTVNLWADEPNTQALVLKWDDTATAGAGDWETDWSVLIDHALSSGSPWHPVRSLTLVEGATGIPGQAIEARYLWKQRAGIPPFADPTGSIIADASRGAWMWVTFPNPRKDVGDGLGNKYGEDLRFPFVDTFNMTRNHKGEVGWNLGVDAEDLGAISSITFKMKLGIFRTVDDSELILNTAVFSMVFWALDRNDRIFFQEFTQRVNNAWEQHTIPIGARGPQSLYNSRIDELVPFFGHKLPNFDFFLPEREFTGVQFDWRQLKGLGMFYKDSYDPQGLYATSIFSVLKQVTQFFQQAGADFRWVHSRHLYVRTP